MYCSLSVWALLLFFFRYLATWVFMLPARQMCFTRDKLLRAVLRCKTPADILLMASETMALFYFIFFIYRAPSIAGASRLSTDNACLTRELPVKYVALPLSLCNTGTHITV